MQETSWRSVISEKINSCVEAAHALSDRCIEELERHGWSGTDVFHVRMAIEEALTNAVMHGNGTDATKSVWLKMAIADDLVQVVVRDEGTGFDPCRVPDPRCDELLACEHGRGLLLMRSLMTDVQFNDVGNQVTMTKSRSAD